MKRPAVFLDRDGTLIEEVNYLSRVEDMRPFPFSLEAVRLFKERGYLVIVVTNQSGISRGLVEEAAMHDIHRKLQTELEDSIDRFYFCPHLPGDLCECRKPGAGMISTACLEHEIDVERSWMIGDKEIDVEAGKRAGLSTVLVMTGYGAREAARLRSRPDHIAPDLLAAAKLITST